MARKLVSVEWTVGSCTVQASVTCVVYQTGTGFPKMHTFHSRPIVIWVTVTVNQSNGIGHRSNTGFHDASSPVCSPRLKLREEVRERISPI